MFPIVGAAIVRVQGTRLDLPYLRENARVLDVSNLLTRALAEASGEGSE